MKSRLSVVGLSVGQGGVLKSGYVIKLGGLCCCCGSCCSRRRCRCRCCGGMLLPLVVVGLLAVAVESLWELVVVGCGSGIYSQMRHCWSGAADSLTPCTSKGPYSLVTKWLQGEFAQLRRKYRSFFCGKRFSQGIVYLPVKLRNFGELHNQLCSLQS